MTREYPKGTTWRILRERADGTAAWCSSRHGPPWLDRQRALDDLRDWRQSYSKDTFTLIKRPPPRPTVEQRIVAARVEERKAIGERMAAISGTLVGISNTAYRSIVDALRRGERP